MGILFAILIFSFLIFIHEFGHFITAKLSGVQVNEFSMFMGPAIWKKQKGETLYAIRCIPIGGYCAMEGEDGDSDNPRAFGRAAWWKRLIILVAGAAMNLLVGILLYAVLIVPGQQVAVPAIREFTDCCTFNHEEGLLVGDEFVEIDGEKIFTHNDISYVLSMNPTGVHDLVIRRGNQLLEFEDFPMTHTHLDEQGEAYLHYGFGFGVAKNGTFGEKLGYVWDVTLSSVKIVRLSLQMLISGQAGIMDMTGPVGIISGMSDMAAAADSVWTALVDMLSVGAMLAINLAVMNLLPIPALDGGRVVALLLTTAIEAVTHKKLNPKYEAYIHGAGMLLLLGLMAVIMFKDIIFIFK